MRRLLLALLLVSPVVLAQTPPAPDAAVVPPPPEMLPFDESMEPQVTIVKDERGTVQEFRLNGRLYMVRITPAVGVPFFLVDRDGDGHMETRGSMSDTISPPMWVIGTF